MRIIIAGAGDVGFHIAKLLSDESLDIVIIDTDKKKLQKIDNFMDVLTHHGDVTSFQVLREAGIDRTDIFIAVTQMQNTNLVASMIAKKMNVKHVIARVSNPEFLTRENKISLNRLGIDTVISPEELASREISHLIEESAFNEIHSFEGGALNLFGIIIARNAEIVNKTVKEISERFSNNVPFIPIFIIRSKSSQYQTIIPRGDTIYKEGDHIYFIGLNEARQIIGRLAGKNDERLSDVIIMGGGRIGNAATELLLKGKHEVKLFELDPDKSEHLAELHRSALVINGDGRDSNLLDEEGIAQTDAFIAVTGRSETNIMACLLAKSRGVRKTIALVENMDYIHLSQEIGIDGFINKKLMAANEIFKYIRRGRVLDVTNLYDLNAEVLEFRVDANSKIANQSIEDLKFPRNAIIGGVVRQKQGFIPAKDFVIKEGDRIVVFSEPESINKVEEFFN